MSYKFNKKELKNKKASNFKNGDVIDCGKYSIYIRYNKNGVVYNTPNMFSFTIERESFKTLDCTPGCGTPYYISDFINR